MNIANVNNPNNSFQTALDNTQQVQQNNPLSPRQEGGVVQPNQDEYLPTQQNEDQGIQPNEMKETLTGANAVPGEQEQTVLSTPPENETPAPATEDVNEVPVAEIGNPTAATENENLSANYREAAIKEQQLQQDRTKQQLENIQNEAQDNRNRNLDLLV